MKGVWGGSVPKAEMVEGREVKMGSEKGKKRREKGHQMGRGKEGKKEGGNV